MLFDLTIDHDTFALPTTSNASVGVVVLIPTLPVDHTYILEVPDCWILIGVEVEPENIFSVPSTAP